MGNIRWLYALTLSEPMLASGGAVLVHITGERATVWALRADYSAPRVETGLAARGKGSVGRGEMYVTPSPQCKGYLPSQKGDM